MRADPVKEDFTASNRTVRARLRLLQQGSDTHMRNIHNLSARNADHVVVRRRIPVKALHSVGRSKTDNLSRTLEAGQIALRRAQADVGNLLPHPVVDPGGGRMTAHPPQHGQNGLPLAGIFFQPRTPLN